MSRHHPNRRRTRIVNRPIQQRLIANMALAPALGLSVMLVLVGVFCYRLWEEAILLEVEFENLVPFFLAASGFVLVSGFFLLHNSLSVSHRIAGPAHRICESLEQIRNGDLTFAVRLRDGDHLTDVRDELNLLLDTLNANPPEGFKTRELEQQDLESAEGQCDGEIDSATPELVPAVPEE